MSLVRKCAGCGRRSSSSVIVGLVAAGPNGADVYACADHRQELAAPPDDVLTQIAQLQDMARRNRQRA